MNQKRLIPLLLMGLVLVLAAGCLEDNPNAQANKEDQGYLFLDGGGPMGRVDLPPPPPPDGGGTTPGKTTRGRFCHNVTAQGGQAITITLKVDAVSMSAATRQCSACTDIPTGDVTLRLYSGSQYLGGAYSKANEQNEYVYLLSYPSGSKYAQLSKEELDPNKGETCAGYKSKF